MRNVAGVLAMALTGCAQAPTDEIEVPPQLSACLAPDEGSSTNTSYGLVDEAFSGTVVGIEPNGCYDGHAYLGAGDDGETAWATLEDEDGGRWSLAVAVPGVTLALGEQVEVAYHFTAGGFSPDAGELHLTWSDGREAWVGEDGRVEDLTPPEGVALSMGDVVGSDAGDCGAWSMYDVAAEIDGQAGTLPYGGTLTLGDATLIHGGVALQDGSGSCPDWFVAQAAIALVRGG